MERNIDSSSSVDVYTNDMYNTEVQLTEIDAATTLVTISDDCTGKNSALETDPDETSQHLFFHLQFVVFTVYVIWNDRTDLITRVTSKLPKHFHVIDRLHDTHTRSNGDKRKRSNQPQSLHIHSSSHFTLPDWVDGTLKNMEKVMLGVWLATR